MPAQRPMRIAVDAMGGDLGPGEVVRGVVDAARQLSSSISYIVVGDEKQIEAELGRLKPIPNSISVRHASQTMEMDDKPSEVLRKKKDASVVVSARLVKDGEAEAFISIGNTGAAM